MIFISTQWKILRKIFDLRHVNVRKYNPSNIFAIFFGRMIISFLFRQFQLSFFNHFLNAPFDIIVIGVKYFLNNGGFLRLLNVNFQR